MSVLLKEIQRLSHAAASQLESAGIRTDSELQSLSRQDLSELFPGVKNFKLRKDIFEKIHKQKPVEVLLEELQGFIPHDSLSAALSTNGILVDYLNVLKDMKAQVDNVQSFLEAHIGLLEKISKAQPGQETSKGSQRDSSFIQSSSSTSKAITEYGGSGNSRHGQSDPPQHKTPEDPSKTTRTWSSMLTSAFGGSGNSRYGQTEPPQRKTPEESPKTTSKWDFSSMSSSGFGGSGNSRYGQTEPPQHKTPEESPKTTSKWDFSSMSSSGNHTFSRSYRAQASVKYKMVVTAKTFDAHVQLLNKIRDSGQELKLVQAEVSQSSEDFQVTIVFCPIVSRLGTDVEAALKMVTDDKPIILVLMHHSYKPTSNVPVKSWSDFPNLVLQVSVFYHESVKGLIQCSENQDAVSTMRDKLLTYSR